MDAITRLATPNFAVAKDRVMSVRDVGDYYIVKVKKVSDSNLNGRAFFIKSGWFTYPDFFYVGDIVSVEPFGRYSMRLRIKKQTVKEEQEWQVKLKQSN